MMEKPAQKIRSEQENKMISSVEYGRINKYRGLSSDTKPTDAPNGSEFYEVDTGSVYVFDAEGAQWCKMP